MMTGIFPFSFCMRRMQPSSLFGGALLAVALTLSAGGLAAAQQVSDAAFITVQLHAVTPHLDAYAQVEPISVLSVSAAETGVVAELKVVPGMHVRAGQQLARLNGPGIRALMLQSQADVRSAEAQLSASQKSLAIQRQQLLSHLSTQQSVHQAESAVAQAQTNLDNAQSRLQAVRQMMTVSAPADAIVLTLNSADGELVSAGQPILTLQPAHRLWLKAAYYGSDLSAIRVGMTGRFSPADRSESIPVKVLAVSGSLAMSGGESIAMVSTTPKPEWINGEFGAVTLNSPQRMLIAVPTRALILDQGKWWVMVHTAKADYPQSVVPGPAQGWDTFVEQGLEPGTQVVVENAYLLFHSAISRHYQLPD
jgi:RND family efflux transporter MFP subunit